MSRSHDVHWAVLDAALARVVGSDSGAIASETVQTCTTALSAMSVAVWLYGESDAEPELLATSTDGPAPPSVRPPTAETPVDVEVSHRDDGSMTCHVTALTDFEGVAAVAVEATFRPDDYVGEVRREMLAVVATVAANALGRARHAESGRRIARILQRHMMPRLDAITTGVAAARYVVTGRGAKVGGDWYDVVEAGDGRTILVLGDVQGHSVEAAAQMVQARTALHTHLIEGLPANVALARANDLLLDWGGYATCCCVELTPGAAVASSAGHPPPLRVNAHGDASVWSVTPGPPLGAMPGATYTGTRLELGPDDAVVLYSDGLIEAPGEEITYGIQRLCRAAANAHTDDLEELVTHLLGLAEPLDELRDDIAVLAFRPGTTPGASTPS